MKEFSKIGEHYVKDAQARQSIETLQAEVDSLKEGGGATTPTKETWTFTLENGTTLTKQVHVG
jgi:hypothetical protein